MIGQAIRTLRLAPTRIAEAMLPLSGRGFGATEIPLEAYLQATEEAAQRFAIRGRSNPRRNSIIALDLGAGLRSFSRVLYSSLNVREFRATWIEIGRASCRERV